MILSKLGRVNFLKAKYCKLIYINIHYLLNIMYKAVIVLRSRSQRTNIQTIARQPTIFHVTEQNKQHILNQQFTYQNMPVGEFVQYKLHC